MHSICVMFDVLLSVLRKISKHFQWLHTDWDLIFVCPDLHGNEYHTCMELLFEDLPSKQPVKGKNTREKRTTLGLNNYLDCLKGTERYRDVVHRDQQGKVKNMFAVATIYTLFRILYAFILDSNCGCCSSLMVTRAQCLVVGSHVHV